MKNTLPLHWRHISFAVPGSNRQKKNLLSNETSHEPYFIAHVDDYQ